MACLFSRAIDKDDNIFASHKYSVRVHISRINLGIWRCGHTVERRDPEQERQAPLAFPTPEIDIVMTGSIELTYRD
jgi:hypothetical protein